MSKYTENIKNSGLTIYDEIDVGHPDLWIPSNELEKILSKELKGKDVSMPIRTRSKRVKEWISSALGYPVPSSFSKTSPRFPGQNFDVYTQKSDNLQIWNEEVDPTRRYVIVRVNDSNNIETVKVVSGDTLAELDTTGKLTGKYQARIDPGDPGAHLISDSDTARLHPLTANPTRLTEINAFPTQYPKGGDILPIEEVFSRLSPLVGREFSDPGVYQERNRGTELHKLVCTALGFSRYADDGTYPDITNQVLEVKLQTSPTIDLGIALPSETSPIDFPNVQNVQVRHCDVRYAVFYGDIDEQANVKLSHLFLTTGSDFFDVFSQFGGMEYNEKIQIKLPNGFFDDTLF